MTRERVLHLTAKDFEFGTFRAGGKGGQNQNKRDTGVRCLHPPSGSSGESREHRTQLENKRAAWGRCVRTDRFRRWLAVEHARRTGELERWLEEQMRHENLEIEYYDPEEG